MTLNQTDPSTPAPRGLTGIQWLICGIAALGFAFDIYELLMLPLVVKPALTSFGIPPALPTGLPNPEFAKWVGRLFFIPAFAGGIFGLLGGYLTDRLGRRRVLTWSILLYAFAAFASGFATNVGTLLVLRCLVFVGVCVEFVAAVAWLAELFPDPRRREKVLGYTQAFSSVGGLLVTGAFALCVYLAKHEMLPSIHGQYAAWRYTLMSGVIPALPLLLIRPFLPESPVWEKKRLAGTLRRPSIGELFAPQYRRTTIVTTVIFACSYGAAFGAIQHLPRIVPGIPQVRAKVEAAGLNAPMPKLSKEQRAQRLAIEDSAAAHYQTWQEVGGLVGRFILAYLAVRILSRQRLLRLFQVPGLFILPLVFAYAAIHNPTLFRLGNYEVTLLAIGIFFCGVMTVAQFSFWGNYLPLVYPVHLRGTGESFAANIGGRMIGTSFAWVTTTLSVQAFIPGTTPSTKLAYAGAIVAAFVYLVGLVFSFFLPEPSPQGVHDEDPHQPPAQRATVAAAR
jgi:MFS family permease